MRTHARGGRARRWSARALSQATLDALEHLIGGAGTATLALFVMLLLAVTAVLCLAGVGLLMAPAALRALRVVTDRERARLSRWGPEVIGPAPTPRGLRAALADRAVRRELGWMAIHASLGLLLGLIGFTLPFGAIRDLSLPLWWRLAPPEEIADSAMNLWVVDDQLSATAVAALGVGWIAVCVLALPGLARLQAWPGRRLLAADAGADLALRVAHLTATRAAALDAHAAELRRIERSLHDGTQNRLVAVTVLLGAARRAVARDPAAAGEILDRAQGAAEQALAELRAVVRTILPPVLEDRSLADALTGLAAACPVPCTVTADLPGRCAVSVEATAYFVVAEALTNVARHSGARRVSVAVHGDGERLRLRVTDDGHGGADERAGSGLGGIRRRAEAHDGTFTLTSPPGGPTILKVSLPCGS
ncbi:histidine kinase [Sphaerisporangium siamense]|uniref:histidine kinase n=1 Tax=Sphaerisporangium siamense TaxID=795645 RepID=A0A7W7DF45_9ACTN|nr:sensor histidine kinase [Sphaerisporangium siamense]MBB4705735.1 signal transduction histidine kinase [Sphaerisporangium siamense]GII82879.1 histidine kinase [Sphaerisporangium siamense]